MSGGKSIRRPISPEEQELNDKLNELKGLENDLIQRELELSTLQAEVDAFQFRYVRWVGSRLAELDKVQAELAEAKARLRPIGGRARASATKARGRVADAQAAIDDLLDGDGAGKPFTPSQQIRSLFLELAKLAHPDLANTDDERQRRTPFMARVNEAYSSGDVEQLQALLAEWRDSPESIVGDGLEAELVRVIRKLSKIKKRLKSVIREIASLRDSDLNALRVRILDAERDGVDLLARMAADVDGKISASRIELNKALDFLGSPRGKVSRG